MQPIHKSDELLESMESWLSNQNFITEFRLMGLLKDIDNYFSGLRKNYAKALAYSLIKDLKKAEYYFELSLQIPDAHYATNYMAIVNNYGSIIKTKELSERFAEEYESISFSTLAFESSLYLSDMERAEYYIQKAIKLSNDEDRMKLKDDFESANLALSRFKEKAGFEKDEAKLLSSIIMNILESNNIRIKGISYIYEQNHEEKLNTYIVTAQCEDPSKIADMNMDLAFKLAEYDELLDKNFSAIIRGCSTNTDGGIAPCL
ncbi:hypothetical protein ACK4QX_20880 [Proteus mirabilis]|uniref:hypothetical protein n=1 Tax=Proteus mirabilis TaxID=584 RepID=UPI00391DE34D